MTGLTAWCLLPCPLLLALPLRSAPFRSKHWPDLLDKGWCVVFV